MHEKWAKLKAIELLMQQAEVWNVPEAAQFVAFLIRETTEIELDWLAEGETEVEA